MTRILQELYDHRILVKFVLNLIRILQDIQPAPSMTFLVYNDPSKMAYNDHSGMVYNDPL